ncbi:MAG TPA: hypothetical protein VM533_19045 [Fimbriiglobus sp.]|jgi:hypothetical protein|nr:hypothetical protein [Fimbriiglobus sp.]
MTRYLVTLLAAAVGFGAAARAGGPPPVYVVVDKVALEPSAGAPERITIWGSFVRVEDVHSYKYGKPVAGCVSLSLGKGQAAETRAEWEKWRTAAGTGKVVAVGSCGEAGSLLTVAIRKTGERPTQPDATYTPGFLETRGPLFVDRNGEREAPVQALLAFVKERRLAETAAGQARRP